jgi:hypothetical protein
MLVANVVVLAVFVRLASASLPDHRAYEMVSAPAKQGADVIPNSFKTVSASDGNGVAYVALGAFGPVKGTATDVQYIARRTATPATNGWSTTAVNPPGQALAVIPLFTGAAPSFEAFTPDLHDGIFRSWKSLTDAPDVAGTMNDYRLRNLETNQSAAELLSASVVALNPTPRYGPWQNRFAGASTDLTHVIVQSPWNLTGDGSFSDVGDLYEQVQGLGVRRVGRIPSGTNTECDDSVPGSECIDGPPVQAGLPVSLTPGGSEYSSGMVSADGSRILFQGPSGAPTGPIYMREDGVRTFQIDASQTATPAAGPAQLWGMSTDGTRVLFTSSDSLTSDDNDGGSSDLYLYDRTAPAGARLTLLSQDSTGDPVISVTSVIGASSDAHYVYFVSGGQLVPDAPPVVNQGLYLWHDGQIRYIGSFDDFNLANLNTPAMSWQFVASARTSRVSPDGHHLLFMSWNDAGFRDQGGYRGYDHGTCGSTGCRELYLYSADDGSLACVSCNPLRSAATGDALVDILPGISASTFMQRASHALADDGQHVFFSTQEALVPEDSNGKWDAYEYDTPTGTIHLLSTGTSTSDSYFMDASPDGHDAFFVTSQQLTGWDTDSPAPTTAAAHQPQQPPPQPPAPAHNSKAPATPTANSETAPPTAKRAPSSRKPTASTSASNPKRDLADAMRDAPALTGAKRQALRDTDAFERRPARPAGTSGTRCPPHRTGHLRKPSREPGGYAVRDQKGAGVLGAGPFRADWH